MSVEVDGQSYVDVRDPKNGAQFTFYDFEYRVALAFDGLPLATVIPWVKLSTGMELNEEQLTAFADRLAELGFLDLDSDGAAEAATVAPDATAPDPSDVASTLKVSPGDVREAASVAVTAEAEAEIRNQTDAVVAAQSIPAEAPPVLALVEPPATSPILAAIEPSLAVASNAPSVVDSSLPPRAYVSPAPVMLVPRPHLTPPPAPWATPRPILTPSPTTLGPLIEQPTASRRMRRSVVLFGSLGVLAAAAVVAVLMPFVISPQDAPRPRVQVLAAAPTTVFRFFDGTAAVHAAPAAVLKFPASGKVTHIVAAGTTVTPGDVLAAVDGAKPLLDKLAGQRERLAFAQQMAEGMREAGNTTEEERQNGKVESRNAKIAKTLHELAEMAVVATAPGAVDEALAHVGDSVDANAPAVRLRSTGFSATFAFTKTQVANVRRLGFCRIEIDGDMIDCSLGEISDDGRVEVNVAALPSSLVDKPARLARARFEAAVVVPVTAIIESGNHDALFVVSPKSRLESRAVTVAERDATVAVVVQGLDPDERVAVGGPLSLRAGMQVVVR